MLVFLGNQRCGRATIESILRASHRSRHCHLTVPSRRRGRPIITAYDFDRTRRIYPELSSLSGAGIVPWSDLASHHPEMRFFTFLRAPLERCASQYQHLVTSRGLRSTFESWIQTPDARNHQVRQLCGQEDAEAAMDVLVASVPFVGLVERFNESLVLLRQWSQDNAIDIRHRPRNMARDSRIRVQLLRGLSTRRQLLDANREDLKLHALVTSTLYARQVSRYGDRLEMDVEAFEAFNVPRPTFPREIPSMLHRQLIHRPLTRWLTAPQNPDTPETPAEATPQAA